MIPHSRLACGRCNLSYASFAGASRQRSIIYSSLKNDSRPYHWLFCKIRPENNAHKSGTPRSNAGKPASPAKVVWPRTSTASQPQYYPWCRKLYRPRCGIPNSQQSRCPRLQSQASPSFTTSSLTCSYSASFALEVVSKTAGFVLWTVAHGRDEVLCCGVWRVVRLYILRCWMCDFRR